MSQSVVGPITREASEDLSAKQYYAIQMDANGKFEVAEGATDLLVGILQNKPESGQAATVRTVGTSKAIASAAIAIGAWVTVTAAGKLVTTTTDKDIVIGKAMEAAAADGDIIEILLTHFTLSVA